MRMLSGVLSVLCVLGVPAWASPSGVVITGFQVRGPAGGNDEYVEIRNLGASNVNISGWRLQGCASASPGTASNRATIGSVSLATRTVLPLHEQRRRRLFRLGDGRPELRHRIH